MLHVSIHERAFSAASLRGASEEVFEEAVRQACLFSHSHAIGMDGARVAAAAVAWLSQQPRPSTASSEGEEEGPAALLRHLRGEVAQTDDMRDKLDRLAAAMFEVGFSAWPPPLRLHN